jgi:hypothetical protein
MNQPCARQERDWSGLRACPPTGQPTVEREMVPGAAGIGPFVVTVAANPSEGTAEAPMALLLPLAALALLGGMAMRRLR